jgi:hypothetical protein
LPPFGFQNVLKSAMAVLRDEYVFRRSVFRNADGFFGYIQVFGIFKGNGGGFRKTPLNGLWYGSAEKSLLCSVRS